VTAYSVVVSVSSCGTGTCGCGCLKFGKEGSVSFQTSLERTILVLRVWTWIHTSKTSTLRNILLTHCHMWD